MVFVEGKEVIFHTTFFAKHSEQVIVHALPGNAPINFRFTFASAANDGGMSWTVDPNGLIQVSITPSSGLGSASEEPGRLGHRADGSPMYIAYTEQAMVGKSLVNFFLLKGPAPTATPAA